MSKYPPKRVKVDAAEVWRMFDEGKTRKEIAEHYGVSLQTICNRITAGRPKEMKNSECKVKNINETVKTSEIAVETAEKNPWQTVPVKDDGPAAYDAGIDNNKGDTEMEKTTENAPVTYSHIGPGSAPTKAASTTEDKPDVLKLAAHAHSMATMVGFVPDHMVLDTNEIRNELRVSGAGADGKVYELELSVTDKVKMYSEI